MLTGMANGPTFLAMFWGNGLQNVTPLSFFWNMGIIAQTPAPPQFSVCLMWKLVEVYWLPETSEVWKAQSRVAWTGSERLCVDKCAFLIRLCTATIVCRSTSRLRPVNFEHTTAFKHSATKVASFTCSYEGVFNSVFPVSCWMSSPRDQMDQFTDGQSLGNKSVSKFRHGDWEIGKQTWTWPSIYCGTWTIVVFSVQKKRPERWGEKNANDGVLPRKGLAHLCRTRGDFCFSFGRRRIFQFVWTLHVAVFFSRWSLICHLVVAKVCQRGNLHFLLKHLHRNDWYSVFRSFCALWSLSWGGVLNCLDRVFQKDFFQLKELEKLCQKEKGITSMSVKVSLQITQFCCDVSFGFVAILI